jgi:hypothetical protein
MQHEPKKICKIDDIFYVEDNVDLMDIYLSTLSVYSPPLSTIVEAFTRAQNSLQKDGWVDMTVDFGDTYALIQGYRPATPEEIKDRQDWEDNFSKMKLREKELKEALAKFKEAYGRIPNL